MAKPRNFALVFHRGSSHNNRVQPNRGGGCPSRYLLRHVPPAAVASSGQCPDIDRVGTRSACRGVGRRNGAARWRLKRDAVRERRARLGSDGTIEPDGRGEARRSWCLWLTLAALARRGGWARGFPGGGERRAVRSRLRRCWCSCPPSRPRRARSRRRTRQPQQQQQQQQQQQRRQRPGAGAPPGRRQRQQFGPERELRRQDAGRRQRQRRKRLRRDRFHSDQHRARAAIARASASASATTARASAPAFRWAGRTVRRGPATTSQPSEGDPAVRRVRPGGSRGGGGPTRALAYGGSGGGVGGGGVGGQNPELTNRLIGSVAKTFSNRFTNQLGNSLQVPCRRQRDAGEPQPGHHRQRPLRRLRHQFVRAARVHRADVRRDALRAERDRGRRAVRRLAAADGGDRAPQRPRAGRQRRAGGLGPLAAALARRRRAADRRGDPLAAAARPTSRPRSRTTASGSRRRPASRRPRSTASRRSTRRPSCICRRRIT